ncbi:MAG TPA: methyltransferase [Gaiellaceae bacterium]|nr:methyltransferase [Gaiellaceae bacterium]
MSEPAPEARLWDCLRGALATRALATVAELRVAEALADGPRRVEDLARESGADADTLHRLLRALASDGIFAEDTPGVFRNTDASDLLRDGGWDDFARLFGGVWYRTVERLDASGTPVFEPAFGADFWTWLGENPHERAAFDRAMGQGGEGRIERLAALEWRGDETVVDVGGGNGSLLTGLLALQPRLRGIVLDLPETNRDDAALGERIAFVPGSFFEQVPPGDVYVLSTILHDWDDDRAAAILRTIRAGAPPGARVLLIEAVVEPGNERDGAKWLDLLMLALFGGRERDETQWRALLEGAGLRVDEISDGLIQAICP